MRTVLRLVSVHRSSPSVSQRLQELHLQHNSIEVLADQALSGLSSLALLDLSRNNLHTIGPASLRPLVSLQVLRITGKTGPRQHGRISCKKPSSGSA